MSPNLIPSNVYLGLRFMEQSGYTSKFRFHPWMLLKHFSHEAFMKPNSSKRGNYFGHSPQ